MLPMRAVLLCHCLSPKGLRSLVGFAPASGWGYSIDKSKRGNAAATRQPPQKLQSHDLAEEAGACRRRSVCPGSLQVVIIRGKLGDRHDDRTQSKSSTWHPDDPRAPPCAHGPSSSACTRRSRRLRASFLVELVAIGHEVHARLSAILDHGHGREELVAGFLEAGQSVVRQLVRRKYRP